MFPEIALRDTVLIRSFVFSLGTLFFFVFIMITKTLPTRHGHLSLGKRGIVIVLGIHLFIILVCTVILVFRVATINNFIQNGIKTYARVQDVVKEKEKLCFSYTYQIGDEMFLGDAEIYDKKEFSDFVIGLKILILVDSNDIKKSVFVRSEN